MPDDVQPAEGAEAQESGEGVDGLYDLSSVPEELRPQIEPVIKTIQGNVTKAFQEAAEYKKQWEPYEQLGVGEYDPESLEGLLSFAKLAEDDEQFAQWFRQVGEDNGLFEQLGYAPQSEDDEGLDDFSDLDPESIKEIVSEAIAERMGPLEQAVTHQEQARREEQAYQEITSRLDEIRSENPDLPEGAEDAILRFAFAYADDEADDPVGKGFDEYRAIVAQGEKGLFAAKAGQPAPPEGRGTPATGAEKITDFEDAKEAALARMRATAQT